MRTSALVFSSTRILGTSSLLALCVAAPALAAAAPQDAQVAAEPAVEEEVTEELVVTGSRIVADGYSAPTPVSVLGAADIQAQAPANLADFVNQLPAIAGSPTPSNSTAAVSSGLAGINAVNLRSLGANRTLVLLDGQRSVGSSSTGLVDINTFPQDLVSRVEVVTGGASAAYGSDAVGGVVNFILDKDFTGVKGSASAGITTYGDGGNYRATLSAGFKAFDDRLHILLNGEYTKVEGIDTINRDWNDGGYFQINNPAYVAGNGQPERYVGYGIGPSQVTPGGLVTSGALRGLYFGPLDPATGRATTGTLTYGQVAGPWMIGGDYQYTSQGYVGINSLQPHDERYGAFGRATFEISPGIELFGQFSYNKYEGYSVYIPTVNVANLTIQRDNAFLPDDVRTRMLALGLTSLTIGTSNAGMPINATNNSRQVYRYVAGARGKFDMLGGSWSWDAYYQRGLAKTHERVVNVNNNARLAAATDAVVAPAGNPAGIAAGTIVCRNAISTNATTRATYANCVPINRIGIGGITQDALDYVQSQIYRDQSISQDVAAASMSGSLIDLPAGPLSIAFGGEYRREAIDGKVPAGFSSGWGFGNFLVNKGSYNVKEGFVELAAPLFEGFDVNGAARLTSYSTSGEVVTWKVGASFEPIPDIRFRGTYSRDIRAPNLDELFAAGTARSNTVLVSGSSISYVQNQTGNPDLQPEKAKSWTVGAVVSPRLVPGLTVSADYYDVKLEDAIGVLQPQDVADLCYLQSIAAQCANIASTGTPGQPGFAISTIYLRPFNFQSQRNRGLDLEATYRRKLADIIDGASGALTLRAMATHYIENETVTGVGFPTDTAGTNVGNGPPSWLYRFTATYTTDRFTLNGVMRGVSSGKIDNSFIECTSNCPASTVEHYTINRNYIAGATYFDLSVAQRFSGLGGEGEVQFAMTNVFNRNPVAAPNVTTAASTPAFPQTSRNFYDLLGRTFRMTVRMKF